MRLDLERARQNLASFKNRIKSEAAAVDNDGEVQSKRPRTSESYSSPKIPTDTLKRPSPPSTSSTDPQRHLNGVDKKANRIEPSSQSLTSKPVDKHVFSIPKPPEKPVEPKPISSVPAPTIVSPPKPKPVKRSLIEEVPLFSDARQPKKFHELQKERSSTKTSTPISTTSLLLDDAEKSKKAKSIEESKKHPSDVKKERPSDSAKLKAKEDSSSSVVAVHKEKSFKASDKSTEKEIKAERTPEKQSGGPSSPADHQEVKSEKKIDGHKHKREEEQPSERHHHKKEKKHRKFRLPKISEKFRKYVEVETHPNGGANILRSNWRRIRQHFNKEERVQFVKEFIELGLAEINGSPVFVICVMENGAEYLRDVFCEYLNVRIATSKFSLSAYLSDNHSHLPVKVGSLQNKQIVETMPVSTYYKHVMETCHHGTFRYGPMHALSLVVSVFVHCRRCCTQTI